MAGFPFASVFQKRTTSFVVSSSFKVACAFDASVPSNQHHAFGLSWHPTESKELSNVSRSSFSELLIGRNTTFLVHLSFRLDVFCFDSRNQPLLFEISQMHFPQKVCFLKMICMRHKNRLVCKNSKNASQWHSELNV